MAQEKTEKTKHFTFKIYPAHIRPAFGSLHIAIAKSLKQNKNWVKGKDYHKYYDYSNNPYKSKCKFTISGLENLINKSKFLNTFKEFNGIHIPHSWYVIGQHIVTKDNAKIPYKPNARNAYTPKRGGKNKKVVWFLKPNNHHGGQGIHIDTNPYRLAKKAKFSRMILQQCVANMMLYKGRKFDLRILVTFVFDKNNNMRLYIAKDAVMRMTFSKYKATNDIKYHLTNTTFQGKTNKQYRRWKCLELLSILPDFNEIHNNICNTILEIKYTMCKKLSSNGKRGFWVGGFDFILDQNKKPWLLEINRSPYLKWHVPRIDKIIYRQAIADLVEIGLEPNEIWENESWKFISSFSIDS